MYEAYKSFSKKLTILRDKFQVELDQAKTMANVCTVIIFIAVSYTHLDVYKRQEYRRFT